MTASALLPCRHRGAEASPGVHSCHSPKLIGLKLVGAELCAGCYCRDHEMMAVPAEPPPRLAACAYLGADTGRRAAGLTIHECRHPAHRWTTESDCRSCSDYLFPTLSPRTPVEQVRRHMLLPPRPQPDGWWNWPNVQESQRRATDDCIAALPSYPGGRVGRGIVIAGGGRYFPAAYVSVRVLRHVGCELPIEVWHLAGEMDASMRHLLQPLGVRCVDADAVARRHPFRFAEGYWWKGWQLKPFSIVHSSFREVLFLDADCYPVRDPAFLFDWSGYRAHGSIFWPDLPSSSCVFPANLWPVFGAAPVECRPFESGQLAVDKARCWRELHLTLHYNAQADYMYRLLWGDKDTFLLAWRRLGRAYAMMEADSVWDTHTIVQHDDGGSPLFLHRCRDKWRLAPADFLSTYQCFTDNYHNPRLAHEDFCFQVLEELAAAWHRG